MCSVGSWFWLLFIFVKHFKWQVTWGERFPGNPFLTTRPRVPITVSIYIELILIFYYFHTRELDTTRYTTRFTRTRSPSSRSRSILAPRTRLQSDGRHYGTTLQHTTKRILGASGGCESRLLKNTKEKSSSLPHWQVVNKLTCTTRLIPVVATCRC